LAPATKKDNTGDHETAAYHTQAASGYADHATANSRRATTNRAADYSNK